MGLASDDSPHAVECELVEDGGVRGAPAGPAERPRRVAFVDGTLRTEARLTRTAAGRRERCSSMGTNRPASTG